jgi:hypothetical protein
LYSTFFGTSVNDEIERRLFGDIDTRGSKAVRAFAGTDVREWHQHFQTFFEFCFRRMSAFGPNRRLAAAQPSVGCRRRTGRSADRQALPGLTLTRRSRGAKVRPLSGVQRPRIARFETLSVLLGAGRRATRGNAVPCPPASLALACSQITDDAANHAFGAEGVMTRPRPHTISPGIPGASGRPLERLANDIHMPSSWMAYGW